MWLVITFLATVAAIAAFVSLKKQRKQYKLGLLALMLTGTFLMVLVDHLIAFFDEGAFIEVTTDGLIQNGTILGLVMVLSVLLVWVLALAIPRVTANSSVQNS